ncbi:hypothetical protein TWF694_001328 [Orbilia ellipsospora]|uniref:Parasitic phase-specific protein PSP-1 n=1 Tax=Orbilia ellipsospora TaxID=2528407 RepID=A0AAV9XRP3_9PEZI
MAYLYLPIKKDYIAYGPDTNCTLAVCDVSLSVYQYRPSLPANAIFIALFGIALVLHLIQGYMWKTWTFTICILLGCVSEMLGYGGRVMLYENPFSFTGFLLQAICITIAPVFYAAGIYFTLSKIVIFLGPQYSHFPPKFYYWCFIPCDILSLVLQSIGGALSSTSSGDNGAAVDISIAGLSFQVFTLLVFISLSSEFAWRFVNATDSTIRKSTLPKSFKMFVYFLSAATVLILIRCAYRIAELRDGYHGTLIHNEGGFIALEGVMIVLAVFCLNIGHPGCAFPRETAEASSDDAVKT